MVPFYASPIPRKDTNRCTVVSNKATEEGSAREWRKEGEERRRESGEGRKRRYRNSHPQEAHFLLDVFRYYKSIPLHFHLFNCLIRGNPKVYVRVMMMGKEGRGTPRTNSPSPPIKRSKIKSNEWADLTA